MTAWIQHSYACVFVVRYCAPHALCCVTPCISRLPKQFGLLLVTGIVHSRDLWTLSSMRNKPEHRDNTEAHTHADSIACASQNARACRPFMTVSYVAVLCPKE